MGKLTSVASFLLILAASLPLSAQQLRPEEKRAMQLKPAVALVVVQYKTEWKLEALSRPIDLPRQESGTGFFFRPDGYLITNGHVVADANSKDLQASQAFQKRLHDEFLYALQQGLIDRYIETQIGRPLTTLEKVKLRLSQYTISISEPTLNVILANGKIMNADILQYSGPVDQHGKDVAILKVPGSNLPTVTLGNSDNVRLQEPVMVMGYPGLASPWGGGSVSSILSQESSLEPTATNGHISALKTEVIGTPLLQSDVAITHGNSGGPAFNDRGEVIGLATYGAQEVQGFNFLVPINTAMEFVRQTGVAPEQGTFNRHWLNALDLYDTGKCNSAIAEFDNAQQFMPDLPDAKKYRAAAVACVDKMSWIDKTMETTGPAPLIGLAAVVIVGIILLVRMRKPAPAVASAHAAAAGVSVRAATLPQPASLPATQPAALPAAPDSYGSIQFISGPLSGRSFKIGKEGLWIGRDPSKCGAVVADDAVSGQHVWVVPVDRNVVVIDKDSTNGTYINSVDSPRISKVGLHNGDRVYLGKKGAAAFTYFRN
jgi:serine protease Do